ncbi:MAG: hypothetical protein WBD47_13910 [Phormidesmis sp.]
MKNSYLTLRRLFQGQRRQILVASLMRRYGWQQQQADRAVTRYLRFLSIASLHADVVLAPTQEIDCVWEADILQNTAQYMQMCHRLCGDVIHHADESQIQNCVAFESLEVAFANTQALFVHYFGDALLGDRADQAAACGVLVESRQ